MMTKQDRQTALTKVVQTRRVATQRELLDALRKRRMPVDQSTLSRDLAELGIRKAGGRYVVAEVSAEETTRIDYSAMVKRFTTCGPHLIVLTTATGQAQPVAVMIDGAGDPAIVGTVAGDDTIFVATRNQRTQTVALRRLEQWFGSKK